MANLKDILITALQTTFELCKVADKAESPDQRELILAGYSMANIISIRILEKFSLLKTKEDKDKFFEEFTKALNSDTSKEADDFGFSFNGGTPQA